MRATNAWTEIDDRTLVAMYLDGSLMDDIAAKLGRTVNACHSRAWGLRKRGVRLPLRRTGPTHQPIQVAALNSLIDGGES